jgi:hypothetical protein
LNDSNAANICAKEKSRHSVYEHGKYSWTNPTSNASTHPSRYVPSSPGRNTLYTVMRRGSVHAITPKYMNHIHSHTFPHLLGFSDTNRFVETFTVNSTISSNSSKSAVNVPTKIISSSATLSIGGTTRSKHSYCSSPSRYDTPIGLPSFGATTNHDKLHKYTVSTTNACANTDRSTSGDTAPKFSTISHYRPLSKTRCLPCTAA